ncbi:M48 family metallopeptidase [Yoonia sp. BS5-3]|uniref:M48 family metallopeptidase n=1 Tax=Yoonia phaeophyticola TaxID=3137369 RepID=A0ABZ2V8B1_9RHOB
MFRVSVSSPLLGGYDVPETLPYQIGLNCPIGADVRQPAGEIILNPHLIKAPRACIDYVLVHELAHLKHHDHGTEFWRLIDAHAGDWRKAKHHLDGLVEVLLTD